tara:strand:+ start:260 stop:904 length:645 start_codon:yes stop_codon:yes gene_type:complete
MAISVTEILGTDSLSGSRLVINDNFNVLTSEINAMEVYFAPSAGTITNLNNVSTEALRVGLSTILLDINASTFDILTNVRMTGNLNISNGGVIRNDTNPSTQNDILAGPGLTLSIGGSTAVPPYSINRCGNANALPVVATLYTGTIGQEIFFIYSEANTGTFRINGFNNNLVLTGAGTNLDLTALGQSVHLLSIDDGAGGGVWYVVGGTGYTVS